MDLETLIPIAIIAVAYIYKAFEKAGKKENKPGQPASEPAQGPARPSMPAPKRVQQPVARNTPEPAKPVSAEQEWWERELAWPSAEPAYREPEAPQMQTDRLKPERMQEEQIRARDLIHPEEPAEEVIRAREMRRRKEQDSRLKHREPEEEEPHEYAEFDLQDAVIKTAILERREF